ncbi:MAG: hypothetical protein HYT80_11155 [Euryarchaeota archaeon]|nr:hypothetical protein [Euryarchaeota archaeon]
MKQPAQPKVLDVTTITDSWKIQLVAAVREVWERRGRTLKPGDKLVYYEAENGDVVLRPQ